MNSNQQVHYNMVETTKPKMMEATQFTREEFDKAKSMGFAISNEFKKSGMQMLAEMDKDPKSALNTQNGGLKNVRRVRVLKNSAVMGDESWLPKNLSLVMDLLSTAKNVRIDQPVAPKPPRTFHLFMEVQSRVRDFGAKLREQFKAGSYPEKFTSETLECEKLVNAAAELADTMGPGSQLGFLKARAKYCELLVEGPKETDTQQAIFSMLDYLQSLMLICSIEGAIGPLRFAELAQHLAPVMGGRKGAYVKDQRPNRNGNGKGPSKPKSSPVVQTKPQTPPQQN